VRAPLPVPESIARRFTLAESEVELPGLRVTLLKPRNSDDLISEADYVRDERLPYWADLWASSEVMGRHLIEERERLWSMPAVFEALARGATPAAIELGCGLGLPSIAAKSVGYDVLATDYYEDALLFAAYNAERSLGASIRTRMVDWTKMPPDIGTFALVLAADVLYEMRYAALVAGAVARTLAPGGVFVLADQGRIALTSFLEEAERLGMAWRAVRRVEPPPGVAKPSITIYELTWRPR
jgi:predicted nicotinamide N-methyase